MKDEAGEHYDLFGKCGVTHDARWFDNRRGCSRCTPEPSTDKTKRGLTEAAHSEEMTRVGAMQMLVRCRKTDILCVAATCVVTTSMVAEGTLIKRGTAASSVTPTARNNVVARTRVVALAVILCRETAIG